VLSFVFNSHHTFACSLRSSSGRKCSVTRVHSRFGDRCFAAAGPRIWNNLPASLRDKEVSCTEFRKQLKTFMFQRDCGASWLFSLLRLINTLTYLLTYLLTDEIAMIWTWQTHSFNVIKKILQLLWRYSRVLGIVGPVMLIYLPLAPQFYSVIG